MSGRLFDYDRRIVINNTRAVLARWQDRLTVTIGLLMILGGARSWFVDRPWMIAAWAALAAGALVGTAAGRLISSRLAFHAFDGPVTTDALCAPMRQHYIIAWHLVGLVMLAGVTLIVRPYLAIESLTGYAGGAFIGHVTGGFAASWLAKGVPASGRELRSWLQRPRAGIISAAMLILLLLLLDRIAGANTLIAVGGIAAASIVLALTIVDEALVRFLTTTGHGSSRIIARQARGALLFAGLVVPACGLAVGAVLAGLVAIVSSMALLLMAMRILAYRVHGKRVADFAVSIMAALMLLIAYILPFILPFFAVALYWQIHRRAAARTWMLA